MVYYTNYDFKTIENKYKVKDIVLYMKTECFKYGKFEAFEYEFDDYLGHDDIHNFSLESDDSCKWYKYDDDMKELSLKFPETVFCLYGDGEESGDTWYRYYKNGKSQYCPAVITYDNYDESKLA